MRNLTFRIALVLSLTLLALQSGAAASTAHYKQISLPADARMHSNAPNEWWYFTGHLRDQTGRTYGFELTNFKFSGIRAYDSFSPYDALYRIDLAITDETNHTFASLINYIPPVARRNYLSTAQLQSRMHGGTGSLSLDTLPGPGLAYHLRGSMPAGALDLTVRTERQALLEGDKGIVPMGVGGYSYYYSLTNMQTSGSLTLHGHSVRVSGLTWMDHQWGTWNWQTIRGWDWMAVQLDNGTSVSLANFTSGRSQISKRACVSFPQAAQFCTRTASMTPLGTYWRSPVTKNRYPIAWRVQVPSLGLDVNVLPTIPDQEMVDQLFTESTYWEGSGLVSGTMHGKPITGLAYTELTGYGKLGGIGI